MFVGCFSPGLMFIITPRFGKLEWGFALFFLFLVLCWLRPLPPLSCRASAANSYVLILWCGFGVMCVFRDLQCVFRVLGCGFLDCLGFFYVLNISVNSPETLSMLEPISDLWRCLFFKRSVMTYFCSSSCTRTHPGRSRLFVGQCFFALLRLCIPPCIGHMDLWKLCRM